MAEGIVADTGGPTGEATPLAHQGNGAPARDVRAEGRGHLAHVRYELPLLKAGDHAARQKPGRLQTAAVGEVAAEFCTDDLPSGQTESSINQLPPLGC